jgi:hypothetical protein
MTHVFISAICIIIFYGLGTTPLRGITNDNQFFNNPYNSFENCPCSPSTKKANQRRSHAKHETNYGDFISKEDTITVSYMYRWEARYKNKTETISTAPNSAASRRKSGTPEDTLYILKGFMWFVSQEGNDCDFHIEIGTDDLYKVRMIVEVTKENTQLQKKIRDELFGRGLSIMDCTTHSSNVAHFDTPLPVIVIGLGLYDKGHPPNTNHGDVHTKKYTWELHPVQHIIFL